jgi:hypothetical protein
LLYPTNDVYCPKTAATLKYSFMGANMGKARTKGSDSSNKQSPVVVKHLSVEDASRMARLYEEVTGRLEEMALIVARNLGLETRDQMQSMFVPAGQPSHQHGTTPNVEDVVFRGVRIVCSPTGCGCYDYDGGVCREC